MILGKRIYRRRSHLLTLILFIGMAQELCAQHKEKALEIFREYQLYSSLYYGPDSTHYTSFTSLFSPTARISDDVEHTGYLDPPDYADKVLSNFPDGGLKFNLEYAENDVSVGSATSDGIVEVNIPFEKELFNGIVNGQAQSFKRSVTHSYRMKVNVDIMTGVAEIDRIMPDVKIAIRFMSIALLSGIGNYSGELSSGDQPVEFGDTKMQTHGLRFGYSFQVFKPSAAGLPYFMNTGLGIQMIRQENGLKDYSHIERGYMQNVNTENLIGASYDRHSQLSGGNEALQWWFLDLSANLDIPIAKVAAGALYFGVGGNAGIPISNKFTTTADIDQNPAIVGQEQCPDCTGLMTGLSAMTKETYYACNTGEINNENSDQLSAPVWLSIQPNYKHLIGGYPKWSLGLFYHHPLTDMFAVSTSADDFNPNFDSESGSAQESSMLATYGQSARMVRIGIQFEYRLGN